MNISTEIYSDGNVEIGVEKDKTRQVFEISYDEETITVRVIADGAKIRILRAESVAADMSVDRL